MIDRRPGGPPLQVRALRPDDADLPVIWRSLEGEAAPDPFRSWAWFSGFLAAPEEARGVRVLVASRGDAPIGLLPLERRVPGSGLRTIGLAGWWWLAPDHADVLAHPDTAPEVAGVIMRRLLAASREWDVLDFDGVSPQGGLAAAWARPWSLWIRRRAAEDVPCPFVTLTDRGRAELLPSRNLRSQMGRGRRAAERDGGGFDVLSEPDQVLPALEEMMSLHNRRFGEASAVFATAARRRFHRAAGNALAAEGKVRLYRLHDGRNMIAGLYAFVAGDRLLYYSSGMVADAKGSPGLTVFANAILAAADEGFSEFDLLRGAHEYKERVATGERIDLRARVVRVGPRVLAHGARAAVGRILERTRTRSDGGG